MNQAWIEVGHGGSAVCPNGKCLAYGDGLWEIATGKRFRKLGVPRGLIFQIDFSPDGKTLAYSISEGLAQNSRPHRVRTWKSWPRGLFVSQPEPGPYVAAEPQEVRVAETATVLKGESAEQAVRTVVCRQIVPGPKQDRWQPLFTTALLEPYETVTLFRVRQRHEQG